MAPNRTEQRANPGSVRLAAVQRKLSVAALTLRLAHGGIAVAFLLAIAYVWWCALTGRRDRRLRLSIVALNCEGVLVVANRGDCPLGGLQARAGDRIPLFELVLSPTQAKLAVPALGVIAGMGVGLVARRSGSSGVPASTDMACRQHCHPSHS